MIPPLELQPQKRPEKNLRPFLFTLKPYQGYATLLKKQQSVYIIQCFEFASTFVFGYLAVINIQ